jgi:hypothetical protein
MGSLPAASRVRWANPVKKFAVVISVRLQNEGVTDDDRLRVK